VLQCVVLTSTLPRAAYTRVRCSVLQRDAACCSVMQRVAVCAVLASTMPCAAYIRVSCSVCCSVLGYVGVWCSVLQCELC